jgi:serine/threonine-protein phosphatase 2B catalytic subunit
LHQWQGSEAFPTVVTIFSAPSYAGVYNNYGAVIILDNSENKLSISKYRSVPNPFVIHKIDEKPVFHDAFSYQFPSIAETVVSLLLHVVSKYSKYEDDEILTKVENDSFLKALDATGSIIIQAPEEDETARKKKELKDRLRDKIRAIGRMERMLKNLREN